MAVRTKKISFKSAHRVRRTSENKIVFPTLWCPVLFLLVHISVWCVVGVLVCFWCFGVFWYVLVCFGFGVVCMFVVWCFWWFDVFWCVLVFLAVLGKKTF